ncbi:MAG: twin arginine translocase protein A [Bacteroidetes bacterium ADurb.Bin012]|jgi:sec-independent protein translocase protein TatA|nr:MAG: twin arginine translocase protein A [Bacteroidetes bacterium ADurb.Bin012]
MIKAKFLYLCINEIKINIMSIGVIFAGAIGQTELIIIIAVILLLFGGKKIPELMRGLGKGVRSFKDGMSGKEDEEISNPGNKGDKPEKS